MGVVNHQYVRENLRIPNHPFVRAKYFSPKRRLLVARNRLSVSAPPHLWHGRKIFRPYKLMIGYAKIFANILMVDSAHGGDRVTEYQART